MKLELDNTASFTPWGGTRPGARRPFVRQLLALLGRTGPGLAPDELVYLAISPAKQGRWVVRRAEAP